MFTSVANTVRRFASEVDLSLMRGKHEEIISDHLSGGQTWLKGKVQASCQDVTSLLTTMTNKGQALTNEIDMSSMITPLITLLILLSWVWSAQAAICPATSVSTFNACKASVNPGDEIVFPNGTYSGFDKNIIAIEGQPEKPITIRGATSAGAVFNGNDNEFIVTGRHLVLKWLKFTNRSTNDAGVEAVLT
jgi:hypothetical protein